MYRHVLALFAILALMSTTTTSIGLRLPLTLRPFNATIQDRESWPPAPWVRPIDPSVQIVIEYYGRYVCSDGDTSCEAQVVESLNLIVQKIYEEYTTERGKIDFFRAGPVVLWFRQEKAVPKFVVEDLAVVLGELMGRYGARELLNAGLVNYGTLAATFELTVPWTGRNGTA